MFYEDGEELLKSQYNSGETIWENLVKLENTQRHSNSTRRYKSHRNSYIYARDLYKFFWHYWFIAARNKNKNAEGNSNVHSKENKYIMRYNNYCSVMKINELELHK